MKDGPVTIGIRPEGFDPEKDGELRCGLVAVEVMGRDTSIVATNANAAKWFDPHDRQHGGTCGGERGDRELQDKTEQDLSV